MPDQTDPWSSGGQRISVVSSHFRQSETESVALFWPNVDFDHNYDSLPKQCFKSAVLFKLLFEALTLWN